MERLSPALWLTAFSLIPVGAQTDPGDFISAASAPQLKPALVTEIKEGITTELLVLKNDGALDLLGQPLPAGYYFHDSPESTLRIGHRYLPSFQCDIRFYPTEVLEPFLSNEGMPEFERRIQQAVTGKRGKFISRMEDREADDRYQMVMREKQYHLANGETARINLGPKYRLFGSDEAFRIRYSVTAVDNNPQDTTGGTTTFVDEYLVSFDQDWVIQIRISANDERLPNFAEPLLGWLSLLD